MFRHQYNLKTLFCLVITAAIVAAAAHGSLLAIIVVYWGPAFLWALRQMKKKSHTGQAGEPTY